MLGRNKKWGEDFLEKKGARTFSEKTRGRRIFSSKEGAKTFLDKFSQNPALYPVNFDRPLKRAKAFKVKKL